MGNEPVTIGLPTNCTARRHADVLDLSALARVRDTHIDEVAPLWLFINAFNISIFQLKDCNHLAI